MVVRAVFLPCLLGALLTGCALPPMLSSEDVDVLLLGEQHDDPAHQRSHRDAVQELAARGRLAALALEMVDQGRSTAGLPRHADEAAVRAALQWNEQRWPWASYAPAVMAAVHSGVPVLGANLPREQLRAAMADASLDALLDPAAWQAQREAIRAGHCDLLPPSQLGPMARVQVARDRAMAHTLTGATVPGRTVVLLAGAGHVDAALGVPRHLPSTLRVRPRIWPASGATPARDHCAELREQLRGRPMS